MDKVLKFKFWILFGLTIPLALAGFFMASGSVKALTEEQEGAFETALNGVNSGDVKNAPFVERVNAITTDIHDENERELLRIWEVQRQWFVWPAIVDRDLIRNDFNGEVLYPPPPAEGETGGFGFKPDLNVQARAPDNYRLVYPGQMKQLYLSLNPVLTVNAKEPTKNRVFIKEETIPRHEFPVNVTATPQQILEAQEDFWLLTMLAQAINEVNQAEDVSKSAIVEINHIELFGGTGESTIVAAEETSSDASPTGGDMFLGAGDGSAEGAGGTLSFNNGVIDFDPAEEYGDPGTGAADGTGASLMPLGDASADGGGGGGADEATGPLRYVGDPEAKPYKQRAFYISVLIDEGKLANFFTALSNLDPPIKVGRFTVMNNPHDTDELLKRSGTEIGGRRTSLRGNPEDMSSNRNSNTGTVGNQGWTVSPRAGGASGNFGADSTGAAPYSRGNIRRGGGPMGDGEFGTIDYIDPQYEAANLRSDLVRLDLTGLFTIFKQPEAKRTETAETQEAPLEPFADVTPPDPVGDSSGTIPPTADGEEMPLDPDAATPETGVDPTAESTPPVEGASPDGAPPTVPDGPPTTDAEGTPPTPDGDGPPTTDSAPPGLDEPAPDM